MNPMRLEGIVKKNSRGRAYLVYFTGQGTRGILRLAGNLENVRNGDTVVVTGRPGAAVFEVDRILPRRFPRRGPAQGFGAA